VPVPPGDDGAARDSESRRDLGDPHQVEPVADGLADLSEGDAADLDVLVGRAHRQIHRAGGLEVVGEDVGGVGPRLVELAAKWQPCAIVVDEVGPAGSLIAPLEAAELEVLKPYIRAWAAADSGVL
jgi:hypothetical protein